MLSFMRQGAGAALDNPQARRHPGRHGGGLDVHQREAGSALNNGFFRPFGGTERDQHHAAFFA
jgi:hypothetical protein